MSVRSLAAIVVMLMLALLTACSAGDSLAPEAGLSCSNTIATPAPLVHLALGARDTVVVDRIILPHHWADTVRVFTDKNGNPAFDALAAAGGARLIFTHGGTCTTLSDSLQLHAQLRVVP